MQNQKFKLSAVAAALLALSMSASADSFNYFDVSLGTTLNSASAATGAAGAAVAVAGIGSAGSTNAVEGPLGGAIGVAAATPLGGAATGAAVPVLGGATSSTSNDSHTSVKFMIGTGQTLTEGLAAGVSGGVLLARGYQMPTAQADLFLFSGGPMTLNPHLGYSVRTGMQAGVDVLIDLANLVDTPFQQNAIRIGITHFTKKDLGVDGTFQIGLTHKF